MSKKKKEKRREDRVWVLIDWKVEHRYSREKEKKHRRTKEIKTACWHAQNRKRGRGKGLLKQRVLTGAGDRDVTMRLRWRTATLP